MSWKGTSKAAVPVQHTGRSGSASQEPVLSFGGWASTGPESIDEQVYVHGNRVQWYGDGLLRWRYDTALPVLQVALCAFEDPGLQQCLALLQQGLLLTYSWQGETHHTPVPPQCSSLHSLPQGLLLQAKGGQGGAWMLLHPLQELQPVAACARAQLRTSSPAQFQGEEVLWSSRLVPTLVTYNQVLLGEKQSRLMIEAAPS